MNLNQTAKKYLSQFSVQLGKAYQVDNVGEQFAIVGPMEIKLRNSLLESVEFLGMITCMDVDQIKGQVINVGNVGIATGRKNGGRFNSDQGVSGHQYELVETDSCASTKWSLLSVWANSGSQNEFMQKISANTTQRFALDMLRVGFNGVSVAVDSDPVGNPLGQDVNKGWHQVVKEEDAGQIMTDPLFFHPDPAVNSDYTTLDAMATELKNTLIHESLRTDSRLVVLVGADLVATQQTHMMNAASTPSEKVAARQMGKDIGGMPAFIPPFFPGKRMVVTFLSNLHCYTQRGTRQRKSENVEDRKQHEDKYWRMEGYAVEETKAYAAIDESAITIGAKP